MSAYQDSEHADPTAADLSALWNRARKMSGYGDDRLAAVESLLEYNPNHARAKSLLAILLANRDSTKNRSRSLSLAREAISLRPEDAALKVAFARLCGDSESALEEKRSTLRAALAQDPGCLEASVMLLSSGQSVDEAVYEDITGRISDDNVQLHYELGAYFRKRDLARCRHHYRLVVRVMKGKIEAGAVDRKGLCSKASFWLATVEKGGEIAVDRCPREYVIGLYKGFAPTFDDTLVEKLHYRTPQLLREALAKGTNGGVPPVEGDAPEEMEYDRILDLGCGTGLSGERFRGLLSPGGSFLGVDLSPEMLVKAKERGCYTSTYCNDIETCFDVGAISSTAPFDLIIACDVFVYLGNLDKVFDGVKRSLSGNGTFAFSVELLDEDAKYNYVCHSAARFSHKQEYIRQLAADYGLEVVQQSKCVLRKNAGADVIGLLTVLR
eukprot:CAMPEP_0182454628 /NCGR_PEP_ID=MMETSP1319-20130603/1180_1 /TAXON_ID=172717 /ORGANISM="Bolidomonas pacifica, Strain RCC208" /LENGTH=439 /DNA_ID=CAMNT_0024652649 /DNA_START=185 /DNA_END=1504 /DNA_ORIENTATION=-